MVLMPYVGAFVGRMEGPAVSVSGWALRLSCLAMSLVLVLPAETRRILIVDG